MQRQFRLTRSADFKRVRLQGKSYAHPLIVLMIMPSELPGLRVGVAAGRSVGGAVHRNRAKRLLRAAMHSLLSDITPGWDLLLIARPSLPSASMQETHTALVSLFQRAKLLKQPHDV